MPEYSPELTQRLDLALEHLAKGETVLLLFEDMYAVNEHFQATLDYFKSKGNPLGKKEGRTPSRYGNAAFLESGVVYFVGKDTHDTAGPTRGVSIEIDLIEWQHELVRQKGLEARLRAKGLA